MKIRIATRASPLALAQAEQVRRALLAAHDDVEIELLPMTTRGDDAMASSRASTFSKDLFVRELEQALLDDRADLAVHSMKDLPQRLPEGLIIAAIGERADPRDALVCDVAGSLAELPAGSRVGTSSLRRRGQLAAAFAQLRWVPMRGNVHTRLEKMAGGECDALALAAAGLRRLGLEGRICEYLEPELCLPAAGQGALALQTRAEDRALMARLKILHHAPSAACVLAERALCLHLDADCASALGAYACFERAPRLKLRAVVCPTQGDGRVEFSAQGDEPQALGRAVADQILAHEFAAAWLGGGLDGAT